MVSSASVVLNAEREGLVGPLTWSLGTAPPLPSLSPGVAPLGGLRCWIGVGNRLRNVPTSHSPHQTFIAVLAPIQTLVTLFRAAGFPFWRLPLF